jgi:hypothetical protein
VDILCFSNANNWSLSFFGCKFYMPFYYTKQIVVKMYCRHWDTYPVINDKIRIFSYNPLSVLMSSILQQLIHLLTLINVLFDTDQATVVHVHWNLCNPTPQFSDIRQKIYDPKEFLWTKIKPEYCNILCNPTYLGTWEICTVKSILYTKGPGKYVQWNLFNPIHQGTREICTVKPILYTKGPGLYMFPWSLGV